MSRNLFAIMAITTMFLSCKNEKQDGYSIKGTIDASANGKKVLLVKNERMQKITVDSTTVQDGKILMQGKVESPDFYLVTIDGLNMGLPLVVENTEMDIEFYKDSLPKSKVTGSKENDLLGEFRLNSEPARKVNAELGQKYAIAQQKQDTITMDQVKATYDSVIAIMNEKNVKLVKENTDLVTSMAFLDNLSSSGVVKTNEAKSIFDSFTEEVKESRVGIEVGEKIEAAMVTAEGSMAPDFSAPTPAGDTLALRDVMGKVTIIDFWAAWCGPCRKENPHVVEIYNKYHEQGLEIIGVSLDGTPRQKDAKQEWLDAIEKDGLTWHQVSNLSYFNDPIAKQYNIQAIPATFVLDSEGKIVAKNLRGDELDKRVAELLQ